MGMTTGQRIRQRRMELGLSQEELANRLGNKSRASVSTVEHDKEDLTTTRIRQYAAALETTTAFIMGWKEDSGVSIDEIGDSDLPNWAKHPERLGDARDATREVDASRAQTPEELWLLGAWRALGTDQREAVANLLSTFLSQKTGSTSLPANEASA